MLEVDRVILTPHADSAARSRPHFLVENFYRIHPEVSTFFFPFGPTYTGPPYEQVILHIVQFTYCWRLSVDRAEDTGLEPVSPCGPRLSRALQYHSANLPWWAVLDSNQRWVNPGGLQPPAIAAMRTTHGVCEWIRTTDCWLMRPES